MTTTARPLPGAFSFARVDLRFATLVLITCVEFVVATVRLTAPVLAGGSGAIARFVGSANSLSPIVLAGVAALVLILSPRLVLELSHLREAASGHRWLLWLVAQLAAFAAFLAVSAPVFGPNVQAPLPTVAWFWTWVTAGTLAVALFLLAAAPARYWVDFVVRERVAILASGAVALSAWASGLLVQQFWPPLAAMTLHATQAVLTLFYPDVYREAGTAILGVGDFAAEIGKPCSGYEGMALITVFLAVYLWLFRRELRFPQAFLLFPAGITLIWIANVLRIAALIAIGASISPDIAADGFHSQAGWITFSVISLALIWASRRLPIITRSRAHVRSAPVSDLSVALLLPLLVQFAASMLITAFSSGLALLYPLGVIATGLTLWKFRARYRPLVNGVTWQSVAIGGAVFCIWLALEPADTDQSGQTAALRLAELPAWVVFLWVAFRIFGSVVTVPIAEELAFRSYLIRKLVANDFENVPPGRFTWFSFLASSVLFGVLHGAWLAGTLAGAGFALALYRRGRIGDAIVAHAVANALIAVTVIGFDRWSLWA